MKNTFSILWKESGLWPHSWECCNFLYILFSHPFPNLYENVIRKIMIYHIPNRNIVTLAYSNLCSVNQKQYNKRNSQCRPWWSQRYQWISFPLCFYICIVKVECDVCKCNQWKWIVIQFSYLFQRVLFLHKDKHRSMGSWSQSDVVATT